MTTIVALICILLLTASAALALWRLLSGPTIPDRTIAFDMLAICIVAAMVLLSVYWETHLFIGIMLIFSLLGFVGTVAFVSYLLGDPTKLPDDVRVRSWRKGER